MKKIFLVFSFTLTASLVSFSQTRTVGECTINYSIAGDTSLSKSASKSLFIKGNDVRVDVNSSTFSQTTFYDKASGNAIVLREIGNNKIMTKLSKSQWLEKNNKYDSSIVELDAETKIILGYECKKAIIKLKDSTTSIIVFYATAIAASVKEYEFQFKNVPGIALEYEIIEANKKIKYTATKINLSPVNASKFDVPVSGYRLLN